MLPRSLLTILFAATVSCGPASLPCVRTISGALGSFDGYDVTAREDGAIVVTGKGSLPWRVLYTSPRNCGSPGRRAGNPMLIALLRNGSVDLVDADGCGEEEVVVTSEAAAVDLARRVGGWLGSRGLRERVAIRARCEPRER
jgi:hypothetical protein